MRKEVVRNVIDEVLKDFGNILVEELCDNQDGFPYTNACIDFIVDLKNKGISIDFNAFDQDILDQVYRELISILSY